MVLKSLIIGALVLANPSLAELDEDDYRVSEPVDLGRPREWLNPSFKLFDTCAGSGATAHTMAEMTIDFKNSCEEVMTEIKARAGATANGDGWVDPHNRGHYSIDATEGNLLKVQRWTENYRYKDVQTFSMTASGTGCKVNACSVSQGNSNNDGGTNMCDMGNLFCNTSVKNTENGVACKSVKYNLSYTIPYLQCGRYDGANQYLQHNCQDFTQTCLRNAAMETTALELPAPETAPVVLSRPREWPNPSFKLFDTCAGSGATAHTMAEMTIDFTNSCEDVMTEIKARAGATANGDGWVDPHNRGHYSIDATEGNLLKVQRWTENYRYKDVQTFSLTASGTGCKVNACSVSQGNSNNDGGTNMCDMGNLFCNTSVKNTENGVACKSVKYNLSYTIPYLQCGRYDGNNQYLQHNCQDFTTTCLRNQAALEAEAEGPFHVLKYIFSQ